MIHFYVTNEVKLPNEYISPNEIVIGKQKIHIGRKQFPKKAINAIMKIWCTK